jgi:hypothetical protein
MTARTGDYNDIVRVMQLYIDGFNDNDIRKFEKAFHEDAWIFYSDADGVLHKHLISESFEKVGCAAQLGRRGSIDLGDAGWGCCRGPAQLGRSLGQVRVVYRLPQSGQD